jgi:hypothetical protein
MDDISQAMQAALAASVAGDANALFKRATICFRQQCQPVRRLRPPARALLQPAWFLGAKSTNGSKFRCSEGAAFEQPQLRSGPLLAYAAAGTYAHRACWSRFPKIISPSDHGRTSCALC